MEERENLRNQFSSDEEEVVQEPEIAFNPIDPTGDFSLTFNEELLGLSFLEDLAKGLKSRGTVYDEFGEEAIAKAIRERIEKERKLSLIFMNIDNIL